MRSRRRFWWAIRLALGAYVVVSGCATSGTLPDLEGLPGKIAGQAGRRGVVIAAPHGSSDARTGENAAQLGRRTRVRGGGATRVRLQPDTRGRPRPAHQGQRPPQGTPGRPPSGEGA